MQQIFALYFIIIYESDEKIKWKMNEMTALENINANNKIKIMLI